jgi:2-hydroxycyclohexanecarboxyl-CoA dehydrogenase
MTDLITQTEIGEKFMSRMVQATPLRRLAQPEEVAALVAYFTSEEARFTTGQVVSVSGGLTMAG